MPLFLTLLASKTLLLLSRLLHRGGGSALPGLVAETLDPQILGKLGSGLPDGVIVITGTNGKTTTAKMLAAILAKSGKRVLTNPSGSNLSRGIVSALIERTSLAGQLDYDLAVFEVDEASMPGVCDQLRPNTVVVTNLFRDQLDRYGELDKTASLIGRAIEGLSGAGVFLNADDPLVASLARYSSGSKVHFFGVEASGVQRLAHDLASDSDHCPLCGRALDYSRSFFSHLGHYKCPNGHFERPEPAVKLMELVPAGGLVTKLVVKTGSGKQTVRLPLPGLYNAYNAIAALAVAETAGVDAATAGTALETMTAAFGRVEAVQLSGREVYLLLVKNPTGFNQIIQTFLNDGEPHNLLIAINDNFADGRDVSWLWDVAFEDLKAAGHLVVASGIRAADMGLRLKYAEIATEIEPDLLKALERVVKATPAGGVAYVLPTYTAMLSLRGIIARDAKLEGFWK